LFTIQSCPPKKAGGLYKGNGHEGNLRDGDMVL
jgi:hypothetical protein